jgi:hypothetical protein
MFPLGNPLLTSGSDDNKGINVLTFWIPQANPRKIGISW